MSKVLNGKIPTSTFSLLVFAFTIFTAAQLAASFSLMIGVLAQCLTIIEITTNAVCLVAELILVYIFNQLIQDSTSDNSTHASQETPVSDPLIENGLYASRNLSANYANEEEAVEGEYDEDEMKDRLTYARKTNDRLTDHEWQMRPTAPHFNTTGNEKE